MVDESWYANTAHNFSIGKGIINTNPGGRGGDEAFLYTLIMGIFFNVFGTSLFVGRLVSVLGGLIGLIGFILILKKNNIDRLYILLGSFVFIFSNVFYIIFRAIRPEGWVVTFVIWGVYFIIQSLDGKEVKILITSMLIMCNDPRKSRHLFR